MLNKIGKWCFTLSAVSPAFGAAAITAVSAHNNWAWGIGFTIAGIFCAATALLVIWFVEKQVQRKSLKVEEIEAADEKVLEFLLAYLLPVFSSTSLTDMVGSAALTIYSLLIVSLAIVHGNMFQFNPVLALFRYHFYVVTSHKKIKYLLITRNNFHRSDREVIYKKITEYVYLEVQNGNIADRGLSDPAASRSD